MDASVIDDIHDGDIGMSCGSGGGGGSARWNPTKEQINMLESLYSQGIRTPSAEQIQQITSRLRPYGHIEGKNVFYWFQNHKARQRQKQKQESTMAYINHRYLHSPAPTVYTPPCPNVVCGSYYMPQSDLRLYPQYPKVLLSPSTGFRRKPMSCPSHGFDVTMYPANFPSSNIMSSHDYDEEAFMSRNCINQQTLPLFPLHPTGNPSSSLASSSDNTAANFSSSSQLGYEQRMSFDDQPFFDFFSGRSSG